MSRKKEIDGSEISFASISTKNVETNETKRNKHISKYNTRKYTYFSKIHF